MNGIKKIIRVLFFVIIVAAGLWIFWVGISQPLFYNEYFSIEPVPNNVQEKEVSGSAPDKEIESESFIKEINGTGGIKEKQESSSASPLVKSDIAPKTVLAPDKPVVRQNTISSNGSVTLTDSGVILETNLQRRANMRAEVFENKLLNAAAQKKVDDMFANQYFEHTSPKGLTAGDLATGAGYEYLAVGENLAMGDFENDADLVQAWMNSPGHRENILKPGFKEIGVAVKYGMFKGRMTWLAVQEFGTPLSACPKIDKMMSAQIDSNKVTLDQLSLKQETLGKKIEQEKLAAQSLEDQLNKLIANRADYGFITAKQSELKFAVTAVNKEIDEYNAATQSMRKIYDGYKAIVDQYNQQVNAYNSCLAMLK